MADPTFISQDVVGAGADDASTSITQDAPLVGADNSDVEITQAVLAPGADDSDVEITQVISAPGADDAPTEVTQLVLFVGRGPEVVPPADSPTDTFTFDEGLGNEWFILLQLSDSGDELRDKTIKAVRVTGKTTRANVKIYTFGPLANIDIDAMEAGTGSRTGPITLPDTTEVQRSKRFQVNCPNSMAHTTRVEGIWDGNGIRDRIDEIVVEAAIQGVRR